MELKTVARLLSCTTRRKIKQLVLYHWQQSKVRTKMVHKDCQIRSKTLTIETIAIVMRNLRCLIIVRWTSRRHSIKLMEIIRIQFSARYLKMRIFRKVSLHIRETCMKLEAHIRRLKWETLIWMKNQQVKNLRDRVSALDRRSHNDLRKVMPNSKAGFNKKTIIENLPAIPSL